MNGQTLALKLTELAEAFPRHEMPPKTLAVYAGHLAGLPEPLVCAAIDRAIETATFPPSIGEIRRAVAEMVVGDEALPETVWAEVKREVRRVGHNRPPVFALGRFEPAPAPEFSDPLLAEAVAAFGWAALCEAENEAVTRAQFRETHRAIRERALARVQAGRPVGGGEPALGDGLAALVAGDGHRS